MTSLSCLNLVESIKVGGNFPIMCKRKRVRRQRIQLVKLLTPFAMGKRSKKIIRKRKCWTDFCIDGRSTTTRKIKLLIKRIVSLKKQKHPKANKLVARKKIGRKEVFMMLKSILSLTMRQSTFICLFIVR
jgi:hypothetical protein